MSGNKTIEQWRPVRQDVYSIGDRVRFVEDEWSARIMSETHTHEELEAIKARDVFTVVEVALVPEAEQKYSGHTQFLQFAEVEVLGEWSGAWFTLPIGERTDA